MLTAVKLKLTLCLDNYDCNLLSEQQISPLMFDNFLTRIEADYGCHGNLYHNATHGADVALTMHYFIQKSSLKVPIYTHTLSTTKENLRITFDTNVRFRF